MTDQTNDPPFVDLEARTFGVTEKYERRWFDRLTITDRSDDDFVRNRLTALLEREVYSERVDTSAIEGSLRGDVTYRVDRRWKLPLLATGAWAGGVVAGVTGTWWALLAGLALMLAVQVLADLFGDRDQTDEFDIPVTAERITWAAYPDAPIRPLTALGRPVRHVRIEDVRLAPEGGLAITPAADSAATRGPDREKNAAENRESGFPGASDAR
jgi:hypothetical protein